MPFLTQPLLDDAYHLLRGDTVDIFYSHSILCVQKGAGDASAREKNTGKTKEEVLGCGEGSHEGGRNEGRSSVSPKCFDNPLWRPLTEKRKEEQAVIVSVFC